MTYLVRYDPFREAMSLRRTMSRLFERSFVRPAWSNVVLAPMDVVENEKGYEVKAELPGVKPEEIELTVSEKTLTLKGQYSSSTKEDKKGDWLVRETRSGSFGRSVTFAKPIDAGKIDTSYENGVLKISVPFSEAALPKKISIKKEEPKELAEAR